MVRSILRGMAALSVAGVVACSSGEGAAETALSLPEELHGMELVESQSGEDAAGMIAGLHEGGDAPEASAIGHYGPEEMRAVLYMSRFATADEALQQMVAMSNKIGPGAAGYGHHTRSEINGIVVHTVFGRGKVNYFYAQDTDLVWLAVPPAVARAALAELLGVPADEVPSLRGERSEA